MPLGFDASWQAFLDAKPALAEPGAKAEIKTAELKKLARAFYKAGVTWAQAARKAADDFATFGRDPADAARGEFLDKLGKMFGGKS